MKGYVYILRDEKGKFYVGSTTDISRRVKQHFSGHTRTTRNMEKPALVLFQEYFSLQTARRVEKKIKGFRRKAFIEKMVKDGYIGIKF